MRESTADPTESARADGPDEGSVAMDSSGESQGATLNERVSASVEYALVFVLLGVSVAVAVTVFFGPRMGGLMISLTLITAAIARIVATEPSPRGLVVRSRTVDVSILLSLAIALAFLGQTAQSL